MNYTTMSDNCTAAVAAVGGPGLAQLVTKYVVVVLYLVTSVFGVTGNSLTIFVLLRHGGRARSVATCFILNLAIADDLFIVSLPFIAYRPVNCSCINNLQKLKRVVFSCVLNNKKVTCLPKCRPGQTACSIMCR